MCACVCVSTNVPFGVNMSQISTLFCLSSCETDLQLYITLLTAKGEVGKLNVVLFPSLTFTYLEFSDAGFVVEVIILMGTSTDALPVGLQFQRL